MEKSNNNVLIYSEREKNEKNVTLGLLEVLDMSVTVNTSHWFNQVSVSCSEWKLLKKPL